MDAGDELLAAEAWPQLANLGQEPVVLAFYGPDRESQAATARLFAGRRDQALLTVDLSALLKMESSAKPPPDPATVLRFALRDARLTGALPFLTGVDACLEEGGLPAALLAILAEHPGTVITASAKRWRPGQELAARAIAYQAFPVPAYAQRRALWLHYLGEAAGDKVDVTELAGHFALDSGRIRSVAAAARLAAQRRAPARKLAS